MTSRVTSPDGARQVWQILGCYRVDDRDIVIQWSVLIGSPGHTSDFGAQIHHTCTLG